MHVHLHLSMKDTYMIHDMTGPFKTWQFCAENSYQNYLRQEHKGNRITIFFFLPDVSNSLQLKRQGY